MLFNSWQFLTFFPTVTILYFLLPHKYRCFLLLIASCIFYMAFIPAYIFILFTTILIDYFAGMWIEKSKGDTKVFFLMTSIIATCLVLFVFKYFNFFNTNFEAIASFLHWNYPIPLLKIILPIGLSFHTFQSLSYVIEVYRGNQKAECNFGIYALYVMFYPQLVAGPIERPQNLLHQFYEEHQFEYQRIVDGLKLMLWGMFKKVVIADRLAIFVNQVYNQPYDYQGISLIIATIFFAFQIYCDFSGYSDIAIGAAQVMGFKLMDNFNRPYFSKSINEFWKRWHISLSTWFKDYLYISLGGNRVSAPRWYFNLFITFLISGLWHGANWTYIIWGALNGFYLIFGVVTEKTRNKLIRAINLDKLPVLYKINKVFITFTLTCFAWIFFRASSLEDAFYVVTHLFSGIEKVPAILAQAHSFFPIMLILKQQILLGQPLNEFIIAVISIGFMETVHLIQRHGKIRHMLTDQPLWLRWSIYYALIFSIIFFGKYGTENTQFIYFQF
ncbi:MAG: MBOAT family protein [Candidatus Saganbacteria bacterium]|nr:MBOAT family protein [Candidatus Saganbacteria bacterium]